MNELTPAIIAKQSNGVVGYVLATDKSLLSEHPLLRDLSNQINKISFRETEPLKTLIIWPWANYVWQKNLEG